MPGSPSTVAVVVVREAGRVKSGKPDSTVKFTVSHAVVYSNVQCVLQVSTVATSGSALPVQRQLRAAPVTSVMLTSQEVGKFTRRSY